MLASQETLPGGGQIKILGGLPTASVGILTGIAVSIISNRGKKPALS